MHAREANIIKVDEWRELNGFTKYWLVLGKPVAAASDQPERAFALFKEIETAKSMEKLKDGKRLETFWFSI